MSPERKILFLGGPSGVGKSHFAAHCLAAQHGWLHIELDQYPRDGIDVLGWRKEWVTFLKHSDPLPLRDAIRHRATATSQDEYANVVLTIPSHWGFSKAQVESGRGHFCFAYLYGPPALCLREFLARERNLPRNLDVDYWNRFAPRSYGHLSLSENHALLVPAFTEGGERREGGEVYDNLAWIVKQQLCEL